MATTLPLPTLIPLAAIQGWQDFLADGEGYLQTALQAHKKRRRAFTAAILYNIIAMAIEKFVMAALMRHGALPYNHTMTDLVEAMDAVFPGALDHLRPGLLELDTFQDICDLDGYHIAPPEMALIPAMLGLACELQTLVTAKISI